jgi:beta-galactosidase
MPLSRREFLEAGVLSSAGAVLENRLLGQGISGELPTAIRTSQQQAWPRPPDVRLEFSFNQGWQFYRPPAASPAEHNKEAIEPKDLLALNDVVWEPANLPHTVRLEPLNASDGRNYQGVCWYRKSFPLKKEWQGKVVYLIFQGAMQVANLWLNGVTLPTHYGGYLPFTVDITNASRFGQENELTVRLDNSDNPEVPPGKPQNELDFTYFGGLYRSVQLRVTHPLFISDPILANKIAGGGVFVTFPHVSEDVATVRVQTDVANNSPIPKSCAVKQELFSPGGELVAGESFPAEFAAGSSYATTQHMEVRRPQLWHPERPHLYILHTSLIENGAIVDDVYTRLGIKTFRFDKKTGFHINGEKFFSSGANRHQDHPYVGYALPASAHFKDAKKLKEAGFNSYRIHYPQDPAFMDACDELGILAIVSNPGWQFMGDDIFKRRVYQNAHNMVRRDRNHPSVILWEAQLNETNNTPVAPNLYRIVHEEYPGPDCYTAGDPLSTYAARDQLHHPVPGFPGWDVCYSHNDNDDTKPVWIREWGDGVDNWTDQQSSARVRREWGERPMFVQAVSHKERLDNLYASVNAPLVGKRARLAGIDLWAGIDYYRGYHYQPFYGSPLDLFRLPKTDYFSFQSQRPHGLKIPGLNSDPMVFIASFGTPYSSTTLTVFSNCEEVRLYQNGKEVGVKKPDSGYSIPHPPFTFRVEQYSGAHSMLFSNGIAPPGTEIGHVKAEGLIGGKVVASHEVLSPGVPTHIELKLDDCGRDLVADGADWVRLYAHICDARGVTYPFADALVTFAVHGEGAIINDVRIRANPLRAEAGIATALLRATTHPGPIAIRASAFGLKPAEIQLRSVPEKMPIWPNS